MIARLTGRVLECRPMRVVLDVAGVGYHVSVSVPTYSALARAGNEPVTLHIHTHVREDALQLYGFTSGGELGVFEELLTVSGVGPRLALGILSGIGAAELRECVGRGDVGRLQKVPGVGKKTAERLLLELQQRWNSPRGRAVPGEAYSPVPTVRDDAVSALVNLGYAAEAARRAIDAALVGRGEPIDLGVVLREALTRLSR